MKGKSFSADKRNKNTEHDTWTEIIKKFQWIKSVERVETFETFQKLSEQLRRDTKQISNKNSPTKTFKQR